MTIAFSLGARGAAAAHGSGRGAIAAAAAVLAFAATAFAPQVLNDGDTFLHIAAGGRMLSDHAILFRDPFSYTFAGAPWEAHEWLAEILMALVYAAGGWSGLLVLFAAAAAATAYVLSNTLGRFLAPKAQALATLLAMACMTGSLLARPHLLALPLLAIWTAELVTARSEKRGPSLALLPLMTIWVNIHASFLLGFALAAGLALEALFEERGFRTLRAWGVFGLGALGAALINPHFAEGVVFPLTLMATPALAAIGEWQATPLTLAQPIVPVVAAALYVIATRRVRLSLVRAMILLALTVLAFTHARHQIVFAVAAPLLLAEPLGRAFGAPDRSSADWRPSIALALAAVLACAGLRLALPLSRGDSPGRTNKRAGAGAGDAARPARAQRLCLRRLSDLFRCEAVHRFAGRALWRGGARDLRRAGEARLRIVAYDHSPLRNPLVDPEPRFAGGGGTRRDAGLAPALRRSLRGCAGSGQTGELSGAES